MNELLLGIDIGTSGCKVSVIDRRGKVVDTAFGEYRNLHPHPGWSEQDPDDWYRVAAGLLRSLLARGRCGPEQIAAVGLDGSTHNAVLADGDFRPLRPAIMWTDQRSAARPPATRTYEPSRIPPSSFCETTVMRPSSRRTCTS